MLPLLLLSACNPSVQIDLSGLEPLGAVGPSAVAPLGGGSVEVSGGAQPYHFAFASEPPQSGPGAELDLDSGEFRMGSLWRVVESFIVSDGRGEMRTVDVEVTDGLAIDPTR